MNDATRRAAAYIGGRLVTGKDASSIFDYAAGRHFSMGGEVSEQNVNVYDYEGGCHIGGTPPSLYHYGGGAHLDVEVSGAKFKGYHYGDSSHYEATVTDNSISLYDYSTGQYYNYSL